MTDDTAIAELARLILEASELTHPEDDAAILRAARRIHAAGWRRPQAFELDITGKVASDLAEEFAPILDGFPSPTAIAKIKQFLWDNKAGILRVLEAHAVPAAPRPGPVTDAQVEAGARAISVSYGNDPDELVHHPAQKSWEQPNWPMWRQWADESRAVLSAVAAPAPGGLITDAQVEAAAQIMGLEPDDDETVCSCENCRESRAIANAGTRQVARAALEAAAKIDVSLSGKTVENVLEWLPTPVAEWKTVVDQPVLIYVVHTNAEFEKDEARRKEMWEGWTVGRWIAHNGGGWMYYGMMGAVTHVGPLPAPPRVP